jgi:DNA helicase IV
MALRMLARRSISGSMTLVGDIGQATSALAPRGWEEVLAQLPSRRPPRVTTLSVNYRTPGEIMAVAAEVLAAAALGGLSAPRSVRSTGRLPSVRPTTAAELADSVVAAAADELEAVNGGTIAVIAAESALQSLSQTLASARLPFGEPTRHGLSEPITLLGLASAKGLEFDSVIVVEPADLVAEFAQGLRALFVALTRTTSRLVIVHARPLPAPLEHGLAVARSSLAEAPVA